MISYLSQAEGISMMIVVVEVNQMKSKRLLFIPKRILKGISKGIPKGIPKGISKRIPKGNPLGIL